MLALRKQDSPVSSILVVPNQDILLLHDCLHEGFPFVWSLYLLQLSRACWIFCLVATVVFIVLFVVSFGRQQLPAAPVADLQLSISPPFLIQTELMVFLQVAPVPQVSDFLTGAAFAGFLTVVIFFIDALVGLIIWSSSRLIMAIRSPRTAELFF